MENTFGHNDALDLVTPAFINSSKGKRFGGYLIDTVVVYAIAFGWGMVYGLSSPDADFEDGAAINLMPYLLMLLYYWMMEAAFGQTIGKMILGMRIVKDDGSKPNAMNVLGRTLCRYIPFDALSLLFGERAWHDSIPNIRVVDK